MKLTPALLLATLVSCSPRPVPSPHFVLGQPYQADGAWYYPHESYEARETGLATVYGANHPDLTTDGELFDQTALAAAHQTLQLPAIARLTNLENGRQVTLRINDRGPATPHRLIEVTSRTAALLAFPSDGIARVRLEVLTDESQAAAESVPGAPKLQVATAAVGEVQQADLPPPGGTGAPVREPPARMVQQDQPAAGAAPALRLPETVAQAAPDPGTLYVRLGTFQGLQYANIQRARVSGLGAGIVSGVEAGARVYRVIIGPLASVAQADSVLDQVMRAGVTDARIVVE